ncbi:HET-domain-containing protein [Xylariaceae sp. FL1019]|nr:HET-domain-containing protein [Xylariaceae sp. FL1019]
MGSFCYAPFGLEPNCDEFRVIDLLPGLAGQTLECNLLHVGLGSPPQYEAVSYVWGDPSDRKSIGCNGKELKITVGLFIALSQLRLPSKKRRLWVDGICINQDDVDERGRQVRCMKAIYSNAARVLIWLGPEQHESDLGISVAHGLNRACRQYKDEGGSLDGISFDDERVRRLFSRFRNLSECPGIGAFGKIVERLWFTRVWVVQELALAGDAIVFCGGASIDWEDLMNAITAQDYLNLYHADHSRNAYAFILQKAREQWRSGVHLSLLSLLFRYRILDSSDPRDKIFGLTALVRDEISGTEAIQADYTVDTTVLYTDIAKEILRRATVLNILSVPPRIEGQGPSNLPSWVPDWTSNRLCPCLGLANYSDIDDLDFAASGSSPPQIQFDEAGSALGVQGHRIDRIADIGSVLRSDKLPQTLYRDVRLPQCTFHLDEWSRVAKLREGGLYVTGEPIRDAFIQTLTTGSTSESITALRVQLGILESNATICRWLSYQPQKFFPSWLVDWGVVMMHAALFFRRSDQMTLDFRIHLSSLQDRRVFRTDRGFIGLASAVTEVGDEIVVVKGAKVPLVLRMKGSKWTSQGDCYLRGIMDGEAFREEECGTLWIV